MRSVVENSSSKQTSGASNFGDLPITGKAVLDVRSDMDDIFSWEKDHQEDWILRKVDVTISEIGSRLGVKTYIVTPPLICEFFFTGAYVDR